MIDRLAKAAEEAARIEAWPTDDGTGDSEGAVTNWPEVVRAVLMEAKNLQFSNVPPDKLTFEAVVQAVWDSLIDTILNEKTDAAS